MSAAIEKSFCTTREAAALLGVSVRTVQLWVESGLLNAWKTAGGHRRVVRESVASLLQHEPAQQTLAPDKKSQDAAHRVQIMVVEDDANLLRLYQAQMTYWPMRPELLLFDNAVAALMAMGQQCPDLLITDLQMPGMNGAHLLRMLDQHPNTAGLKKIVVTGLDADALERLGPLPVDVEVLPKPIPFAHLLQVAEELAAARKRAP